MKNFLQTFLPILIISVLSPFLHAEERPNIILIMVDDMGFSDLGYHGGEIETPNLDALAGGGVRFSQFYNSGRCCPTRATLVTGLHPHQTGIGWMTESPTSKEKVGAPPAYQGHLNEQCATVAEALKPYGYATLMSGKWHLGFNDEADWPRQRGFDRFYGSITGATRFFHPHGDRGITLGNEMIETPESTTDEAYYTTDAFTDYGIRFIEEHLAGDSSEDPYFLYLAYTAPHWPLQAFEDDIAKYRGKYKMGWDKLREQRYRRQIELGLIDESWALSPKTEGIPDWDSLDEAKQDEMDLKMAIYAAMVDRVDQNIGKLVERLKASGTYEDTLILFLSDNGACQEGGMLGRGEFFDKEKRNLEDTNSYGEAWANAGSTPFRYYKHFAHEGGTATPFFMHWPAGIETGREWYDSPAQLIDIVPTILDVAGAKYPEERDGRPVPSLDGISLRPAFEREPLAREEPIFVEHETNAFARDRQWKLVGKNVATINGTDGMKWELYDMLADRTETNNLAVSNPGKVRELADAWAAWADRVKVYPRDKNSPRPGVPTHEEITPQIGGREFTIKARVRHKKPNGVVISQGGNAFGYSLFFEDGVPAFAWRNRSDLKVIRSEKAVSGAVDLVVKVEENMLTLMVDGATVASSPISELMAEQPGLGMFVGADGVHAVARYKVPNRFNGSILQHEVVSEMRKVAMRTPWSEKVVPEEVWSEYPRPQLRRDQWTNLNGHWDYAVTGMEAAEMPESADGRILVPFAFEAPLSGVEERFMPDDVLWYRRSLQLEKKDDRRYLLNFEAVDYESTVWVNGKEIGSNKGGNLPFSFDATEALRTGENEIRLRVTDATDSAYQLHGKQRLNPKGIWYTPVSGIWQTVWMEEVVDKHVTGVKVTTQINGRVLIEISSEGEGPVEGRALVRLGDTAITEAEIEGDRVELSIPNPELWTPDSPTLYDVRIEFGEDVVESYFGIRETGIEKDEEGHLRFTLNGKPIFHWGTLDQGWWPDGLLTPPSDEAMVSDIKFLKASGFNTIRKHIKVEPRRYYYHCDKMGMLVWQDQVSARRDDDPEWTRLNPGPPTLSWPEEAHQQYLREHKLMIDTLYSHPCIVQWVPYNERWGQHQTMDTGEWVVPYDPTRQINIASGGNFFPVGHIVDAHHYPDPEFPWEDGEGGRFDAFVKVMGEFGGHGYPVEGHLWDTKVKNWGYGGLPENEEEWIERYRVSIAKLLALKKQGIAAGIYTQTTDVEGEINGLITYDRKVKKISAAELHRLSRPLFE
ncbi:MAG: sulfatase-like hydrolase/transferase [Verrucomicrobiales bacterium]|nr:sulfatase-like hydrolase/transferase [Verrucomicrobiales bacterium]